MVSLFLYKSTPPEHLGCGSLSPRAAITTPNTNPNPILGDSGPSGQRAATGHLSDGQSRRRSTVGNPVSINFLQTTL